MNTNLPEGRQLLLVVSCHLFLLLFLLSLCTIKHSKLNEYALLSQDQKTPKKLKTIFFGVFLFVFDIKLKINYKAVMLYVMSNTNGNKAEAPPIRCMVC